MAEVSKVILNDVTLIDVTDDTVEASKLLSGYTATKNDGTEITGSIATKTSSDMSASGKTVTAPAGYYASAQTKDVALGTVTSGTASITSVTVSDGSATATFAVSGSANVSAPTVGTAGYVSSSEGTKNAKSGGATISATIPKIVGTASVTATTKKPVIAKQDVPSGVTQAASGDATTTAPSSGVYVAVQSASNTSTLTPTVSITTSGYGTSSKHGITTSGASVGADASDMTYVPITTSTDYTPSVVSASVSKAPVVTTSVSGTVTSIASSTQPSGTDGTDYWTITASGTPTTGTARSKAKATINTSSWIGAGSKTTSSYKSLTITPTVTTGASSYIAKGTPVVSTSGGTSSGTIAAGTQIKIGAGYYPTDLYYQADEATGGKDMADATITLPSTTITYDGSEKTKPITSVKYNGTTLTQGTDYVIVANSNKATNAGTHTLIIAGIGDYTGFKTATWTIAKANSSITPAVASWSIDNFSIKSIGLTITGDGIITTTSSNSSAVVSSIENLPGSGYFVDIKSIGDGNSTVTVYVTESQNYNQSSATISVSSIYIYDTLASNTPAKIQYAVDKNQAHKIWSIGDLASAITIAKFGYMASNANLCPYIIGFNHNSSVEGNGVTFMFGKVVGGDSIALIDSGYGTNKYSAQGAGNYFCMSAADNNTDGWQNCHMRTNIMPLFEAKMPTEWKNVISSTTKYTNNSSSQSPNVTTTSDKYFLLSEYEVFGYRTYAAVAEQDYQMQYAYFSNGNSKRMKRHTDQATYCYWLLRSNHMAGNGVLYYYCGVSDTGANPGDGNIYGSSVMGISPAFRIGPST